MAKLSRSWLVPCSLAFAALGGAVACGGGGGSGGGGGDDNLPSMKLEAAFDDLTVDGQDPVKLVQHPTNDDRWYVVQQGGTIITFLASNPGGAATAVDVTTVAGGDVNLGGGQEQGLLGLAFDPEFDTSGEVYLTYTDEDANRSVLARYVSDDGGLTFAPDTNPIVLAIPHPQPNHNAGDIVFGEDGFLYYSMGDGGGSDDPDDNGQDTRALLGKILRIDVNGTPPLGEAYAIPGTNPFAGNAHCDGDGVGTSPCPEIFAWGFRNPWRMSFDPDTGALWVGDVGQSAREEIDLVLINKNFGWDCVEGDQEHTQTTVACSGLVFEPPRAVHGRDDAKAISGGVVYRGSLIPDLDGFYLYGDFITGRFFALNTASTGIPPERISDKKFPSHSVSAFGQGRDGEVYVVTFDTPSIYKVVPAP